jgi:16S rRNA (adenine1518-N6/adenine1519-N6)-dimethyltransferase
VAAPDAAGSPPPRRRFGQHFLADPSVLQRIVEALDPQPGETVVEIGPGRGALTDRLVERAGRVVAIEIDHDLAALLRRRYAGRPGVEIVDADALGVDWTSLAGGPFLLAGNLPYYITTPLLFRAIAPPRARRAVLLVQREVADRLLAPPGTREYGALTVNVALVAGVERVCRVPAGAFHPRPAVESAVVRLTPLASPLLAPAREGAVRRFVQDVFGLRRKQMKRVVRTLLDCTPEAADALLSAAGIAPTARPETLAPADFVRLHDARDA